MKNIQNEALIAQILRHIPANLKSVPFLMEFLNLSSESVYRRLRGEIPFSIYEVFKLSLELGFSIDEVNMQDASTEQAIFRIRINTLTSPYETFISLLKDYCNDLLKEKMAKNREAIMSLNHLIFPFSIGFDYLFKFNYYRWTRQTQEVPLNYSLSEVHIPQDIIDLCNNAKKLSESISNTTFILDQNIFVHTIKDIQHYYQRKLITKEELESIKNELLMLIDLMEKLVQRGSNSTGACHNIYISLLNIKSNLIFTQYDDSVATHMWYHFMMPLSSSNRPLCFVHKKWLNSLKKYSVLISQSNEIFSSEFFYKQRKYINEMDSVYL